MRANGESNPKSDPTNRIISIENVSQDIELKEVEAYQSPDDEVNLSDEVPSPNQFRNSTI